MIFHFVVGKTEKKESVKYCLTKDPSSMHCIISTELHPIPLPSKWVQIHSCSLLSPIFPTGEIIPPNKSCFLNGCCHYM